MKKILIWGVTYTADLAFQMLCKTYNIMGFYDNDMDKQGKIYHNLKVFTLDELIRRKEFEILIAVPRYKAVIEKQCYDLKLKVMGIFREDRIEMYKPLHFEDLIGRDRIELYAGDVPTTEFYKDKVGLSICQANDRHIYHNILDPYPLPDNSVDSYVAEDVLEHLPYDSLINVINEIHRVLKWGGVFRLALPDYRNDIMDMRSLKDEKGDILFDPNGGGSYKNGKVIKGGHLWFPKYETVKSLIENSLFAKYEFLHYYNIDGSSITNSIDYSIGYIQRTPDL